MLVSSRFDNHFFLSTAQFLQMYQEVREAGAREASAWSMLGSLIWCQLHTIWEALILSVAQGVRVLSSWSRSGRRGDDRKMTEDGECALYEGLVWHQRKHPVRHEFTYKVRYAFVNLDKLPSWFATSASRHHMTAAEARSIAGTQGPVHLLCMPTSVGYEQNPLSVYYCYDQGGSKLLKAIAEVTNTPWGERVTFTFNPADDTVAKPLHVSPFMDMAGSWLMHASPPDERLALTIRVDHPQHGNIFMATLRASKLSRAEDPERFVWLMPHKVATWIYWQALLLLFKGVPFVPHPKYTDGNAYRERALLRDEELLKSTDESPDSKHFIPSVREVLPSMRIPQCPVSSFGQTSASVRDVVSSCDSEPSAVVPAPNRFCAWRDAAGFPWL